MRIAYTMAPGRGDTDLLMAACATQLQQQGLRLCGTVQINTTTTDCDPCDMDVRVLPDGPVLRISQALGREARGCRLDPAALETAVGLVAAELARGADVLIVNKFGKHEAEGRGFRDVIAEALSRDIPVIVGLNSLNKAAFLAFSDGLAEEVEPDPAALLHWLASAVRPRVAVA
jgi:nucleoside-triphosphatase THEP1